MPSTLRSRFAASLAAFAVLVPVIALAHPGHDEHPTQNAALLSAVVSLGGGADHFSAAMFRRAISASMPEEDKALRSSAGDAAVDRFDNVFTYVVNDGLSTMKRAGKVLPAPTSTDPKVVAVKLYAAGQHDGVFDIEHLFDTLFSPDVHDHAMVAVGRKYGADGEAAYHTVFARLVQDVGKS